MPKPRITVIQHPMALEQLTLVRDKSNNQIIFRKAIFRLGRLLAYEFLRTLDSEEFEIETPLRKTTSAMSAQAYVAPVRFRSAIATAGPLRYFFNADAQPSTTLMCVDGGSSLLTIRNCCPSGEMS